MLFSIRKSIVCLLLAVMPGAAPGFYRWSDFKAKFGNLAI